MDPFLHQYVGIDGEGIGRRPHRYVLLAVSDDTGNFQRYIEEPDGLSTTQCLGFVLNLRQAARRLFGFAFNYDLTMMLRDCSDEFLYYLFRPDLRVKDENKGPEAVTWQDFEMNLVGGKFTLSDERSTMVIWDVWKFYQCKFVKALEDWQIAPSDVIERIESMKNRRDSFTLDERPQIRGYCLDECQYMGKLVRRLVECHRDVDLELKNFHGAGSTAKVILKKMGIGKKRRDPSAEFMPHVMRAFFGGRFEYSIVGRIDEALHNHDISSAYPYQITLLPCLEHGAWRLTTNEADISRAKAACVWWKLGYSMPADKLRKEPWGPFPFRTTDGTILFPVGGGSGWCWGEEYLSAKQTFPHLEITMISAVVLESDCDCQPFADVPKYYRERVRLGKEARGKILKFGPNALYGKLAQSVGNPEFSSWVWAGMTTSNVRGQLLRAAGMHKDMRNLLSIATDGIYTRERLMLEKPRDTGTYDLLKPLGGWEHKDVEHGLFLARPGVYFPLELFKSDMTEEELDEIKKEVRARGFGRKAIFDNGQLIMDHWDNFRDSVKVMLPNIPRFYGVKTSISRGGKEGAYRYKRKEEYGDWYEYEPFMSFSPLPKRVRIREDNTLEPHILPLDVLSAPYKVLDVDSPLRLIEDILEEQGA